MAIKVVIEIDKDLNVTKSVSGAKGKSCETLTSFLDKAMNLTEVKRTYTDDYHKGNIDDGNKITA